MLSLEEAENQFITKLRSLPTIEPSSKGWEEYCAQVRELQLELKSVRDFYTATPTQQLCMVAKELNNEARPEGSEID